ncbi:MAG: CBS domain-containing protein [Flavobacteriales bacterium]|nr:CBS domain-containing protein [Flavobacteriales bacterium]
MQIINYITNDFKPLSPNDTVDMARVLFDSFGMDYLPIVEDEILVGCLPSDFNLGTEEKRLIGEYLDVSDLFFIHKDVNLIDALRILGINDSNTVFVINDKNQYLGYVTQYDVMSRLSSTPFFNEIGGVIVVKKSIKEYAISEIAQIVESENAKILGVVLSDFVGDEVVITIKIDRVRLGTIEASLKRFGYVVLESYHENNNVDDMQDRYDSLMSYLSV